MAAIRKLEENLPDPEAFKAMEALYGHVSECLKPADDYYEITHFRQALLRSLFGDPTGAKAAINSAYLATKNEERGRVLYWLGILDPSLKEKAWGELVEKQPLTYHALQVWKQTGKDPLEKFNLRPEISVSRSIEGLSSQTADDLRWLESLYLISRASAAERFTKWMMAQADDPIPASAVIYIGSLKAGEENHHNAIKFLTERIVKNPSVLSPQVLRLLYPAPYFETFDRNSSGIDIYLVMGLARQESAFNASARSPARAQGLMQILPVVARVKEGRHKPKPNLLNVETNVRIGTKLLRDWIDQFGGVEFALAAYNAGPRRVPDWRKRYPTSDISLFIDLIPFKETRNYVGSILRNNYWYHRLYDNDPLLAGYKKNNTEPHNRNSQLVLDILAAHKSSSDTDGPSTSSP
jgi:soluble lytic murein transglycosylase